MAGVPSDTVLQFIRQMAAECEALPDKELLERFVRRRDETAFAELVERHGPLVLGVCRRVLRQAQDAEDAFQATFLVLVRKAGAISRRESVGSWLYGVAARIALKAKSQRMRRRLCERARGLQPAPEVAEAPAESDSWPTLVEELNQLPERYRLPLVLCYLEGRTTAETARLLGCARGTVLSRLARARDRLRLRLSARGVLLPAAVGNLELLRRAALAGVPAGLAAATVRAATGGSAGAVISAQGMALAKGALRAMSLRKLRAIMLAAVVIVLACGVGWVTQQALGKKTGDGGADSVPRKPATFPIVVTAEHAGASAEEVERQVTVPLEVALAGLRGLEWRRSRSDFGLAQVRLEFAKGTDRSKAREEIVSRLKALEGLPPGVLPTLGATTPADDCLRYVLLSPADANGRDWYTLNDLRCLQDSVLSRRFRRVQGVADVDSVGGTEKHYEVHPDPDRLKRFGITLQQLGDALAAANKGGDYRPQTARPVGGGKDTVERSLELKEPATAAARLRDEEKKRILEIRGLTITSINDKPVRVGDVVEGGWLPPGGEPGKQGVVVGQRPRRGRVGYRSAGKPDQPDLAAGIVALRPEEDRPAALKRLETLIKDLNEKPGHLLPGARLVPVCRSSEAGKWLAYDSEGKALHVQAAFPFDASQARIAESMPTVRGILVAHPEVQAVLTQIGDDSSGEASKGVSCVVLLRPGKERAGLADDLGAELTAKVPGVPWEVTPDCHDPFLQAFEAAPGEHLLKIIGPDLERLEALAHEAKKKLGEIKGVKDVVVRHLRGRNDLEFRVDPEKCKKWGFAVADVTAFIESALRGPRIIAGAGEGEKQFDIAVGRRVPRDDKSILDIPVDIINNQIVPPQGPGVIPSGTGLPAPSAGGSSVDTRNPISNTPRIRLRDLVTPVGQDGKPDPEGIFPRAGAAVIYREQGRRLVAVRFRVTAEEKTTLAEARKRVDALLAPPYRAVWEGDD